MNPRAFVVMPFGTKNIACTPLPHSDSEQCQETREGRHPEVDFDSVWRDLIMPALEYAGCEPFRADSETSAGDIRTDMFFELVTADYVVADLSITNNPNVYYELGIRDGVCDRGVFLIDGGWPVVRPFDVAQDRSFQYKGELFEIRRGPDGQELQLDENAALALSKARNKEAENLGGIFRRAFAADRQGTGSPLYSHLPGMKPANWDDIDTSRARAFGSLENDWQERVRRAQELHRPGHILTIAQYAPTRVHRKKILLEAAQALIGLEQFSLAESVLKDVLQLAPDDTDAQLQFVISKLSRKDGQNHLQEAEQQLRKMLEQHQGDALANMVLGAVYRLLWYVTWRDAPKPRERAKDSPRMLLESILSFYKVHKAHPDQYFSGYNALLLMAVAKELFPQELELRLPRSMFNAKEMTTVVRYTGNAARQIAEESGNYQDQFWSAVALCGLELIDNNEERALQALRDACAIPATTLFDLRWLEERVRFLRELEFRAAIMDKMVDILASALKDKSPDAAWNRVFVLQSQPVDRPGAKDPVFPRKIKDRVEAEIKKLLDEWNVGKGDLAICSASTECDIFFGQACRDRGATLRILLLEPTLPELAEEMRDPGFGEWTEKRASLLNTVSHDNQLWCHATELGSFLDASSVQDRHSRWILNTARIEAEYAKAQNASPLYGIALSAGTPSLESMERADDASFFVAEIRKSLWYQGVAKVIDLDSLRKQDSAEDKPQTSAAGSPAA